MVLGVMGKTTLEKSTLERKANCSCGQLTVRVVGEPSMVGACSCIECQRRTGSVFGVQSFFKNEQIVEKLGKSKSFTRTSDNGFDARTYSCPECGSTVFAKPSSMSHLTAVSVGCFGDPNFPEPQLAAWSATNHHWVQYPEKCNKSGDQQFD